MNPTQIILFDGICHLCCRWVQFIIRRDKKMKFKFASLQSEYGKKVLLSVGLTQYNTETIFYLKGNNCYSESSAVLEILTDLGGIWQLFSLFKLIPKAIRNVFYQLTAKNRYRIFGKRTSCMMPTPENHKRFLS